MSKNTNESRAERKRRAQKLEALLLEGIESGEATPFTHADFDEIKSRSVAKLKAKTLSKEIS